MPQGLGMGQVGSCLGAPYTRAEGWVGRQGLGQQPWGGANSGEFYVWVALHGSGWYALA